MSPKKSEQVDFFATETEETEAAEAREICNEFCIIFCHGIRPSLNPYISSRTPGIQMSRRCHMATQTTYSPSLMLQISHVTFEALYDCIGYMGA